MASIVWFRNDLRVRDNNSLLRATQSGNPVIGVYVFDPKFYRKDRWGFIRTGRYRAKWLIESVAALQKNLAKHNIPLLVSVGKPCDVITTLARIHESDQIFLQKEWTQDEVKQVNEVRSCISPYEVEFVETYDQFLMHPDDTPFTVEQLPRVFTGWRKKVEKTTEVRDEVNIDGFTQENPVSQLGNLPTLQKLGHEPFTEDSRSAHPFIGGENTAWERIEQYFWQTNNLAQYKQTRNGLVGEAYSSKLSAWLAAGCISARSVYHQIRKYEEERTKNQDTYWLIFELLWRDFFKYVSLKHEDKIFKLGGILDREYEWKEDDRILERWINGETHEAFVNANMNELAATGFMSNRGRQNVASYFAKNLELDWRYGAAYMESLLVDYDVHSNWGNWMYTAGVGNDPRDRKFNIQRQQSMYDPRGEYVDLWT